LQQSPLFYLNWIAPLKETKMKKALEKGYWKTLMQTPKWFSWAGYAFEAICYKHLNQIRHTLDLLPTAIPNSWRYIPKNSKSDNSLGAQIDLLFDRQDNSITICEIKYVNKPFNIDKQYSQVLENKIKTFKMQTRTKKQIFVAMIVSEGLISNSYSEKIISHVVTIDDLFES
jgi:hypothetical protein